MKQSTKDAIKGAFIGFFLFDFLLFIIGSLVKNTIPVINFDLTTITPSVYLIIPIVGALLFVIGGKTQARSRRQIRMTTLSGPPSCVAGRITFPQFGVNWRVQVGTLHRFSVNRVFYAESCHCPKCNTRLMRATKDTILGWGTKEIWRCPNCNFEQQRPKKFLYREDDAVESVAQNIYEQKSKAGKIDF